MTTTSIIAQSCGWYALINNDLRLVWVVLEKLSFVSEQFDDTIRIRAPRRASGLGKTTLCRTAVRELDRRTVTSIVFDPFLSVDQLLTPLLADFGVISRDDLARAPDVARDMRRASST